MRLASVVAVGAGLTIAAFQGARERAILHLSWNDVDGVAGPHHLACTLRQAGQGVGATHDPRRVFGVAGDAARGSGDAWLGVLYIGDRDPHRIAEYICKEHSRGRRSHGSSEPLTPLAVISRTSCRWLVLPSGSSRLWSHRRSRSLAWRCSICCCRQRISRTTFSTSSWL